MMYNYKSFFLLVAAFSILLSFGLCDRWKWLPTPHLPITQPTLSDYTVSDLHPVAFPASSSGKLKKGPIDWKKVHDFPIFSLSTEDDTDHGVAVFGKGGGCMKNTLAEINGLPKAWMEMELRKGVAQGGNAEGAQGKWEAKQAEELTDVALESAYSNPVQRGQGKSSACIEIDVKDQGAEHVLLWRRSTRTPRTTAAVWYVEGCAGVPEWIMMGLGEERRCAKPRNGGTWRSMRVWYGSERLKEDQWGDGSINLTHKWAQWKDTR